jgi:hypothetical protein
MAKSTTPIVTSNAFSSRAEALLAQILLHFIAGSGQKKQASILKAAGFSNTEIATLLGTNPEVIGQVLYKARRDATSPRRKKAAPKREKR